MTNFRPTEEERSPMSETERRHAERGERTFPISVTIAAPIKIEGQSLDFSNSGVLFTRPRADLRERGDDRGETISRSIGPGVSDGLRGDCLWDRAGVT